MATQIPEPPLSLKPIKPYLKVASDIETSQPVVSYYVRFFALQKALEIDKKSPEARNFIATVMGNLESFKSQRSDEGIRSETVGQPMVESYGLMLFKRADEIDRAAQFSPNLVKLFYTASLIFEALGQFGPVSEDIDKIRKYAKWKAAYLTACFKSSETPIAGPPMDDPQYANIAAAYTGGAVASGGGVDEAAIAPPVPPSSSSNVPSFPPELPQVPKGPSVSYPPAPAPAMPPHQPAVPPSNVVPTPSGGGGVGNLSLEQYARAMKHCKFAQNALQYEDSATAVLYLEKALKLLRTGNDD